MTGMAETVEIEVPIADLLERIAERPGPVVLTRGGEPLLAVMSVDALRRIVDERELLRRLALGELESAGGVGAELEAVLDECRSLVEGN